jgi:hypothetical protein
VIARMVPKVLAPAMRAGATVPAQRRRAAAQDGGERAALVSGQPCACARQELRSPARDELRQRRQGLAGAGERLDQAGHRREGLLLTERGQVGIDDRRIQRIVSEVSGELAQIDARFQQVRGVRMAPISRAR